MNLEQRIGRIDRPRQEGQVNTIQIYTFPSMAVIEAELNMTERLRRKLEGIYKDTQFDDLVLPQYREFLNRILQNRSIQSDDVQTMIHDTIQAIEQADENGIDSTPSPLVANCSASRTVESTMIIEVTLRDVNGQEIDRYLRYVKIGVDFRTELSVVESVWHEARLKGIRSQSEIPPDALIQKRDQLLDYLKQEFLASEARTYNDGVETERQKSLK